MDDKNYFEDLDPKTFSEQDWQDIFDLSVRNPEKFRAMFRDEKVATESEKILREFSRKVNLDSLVASKMEMLDKVGAPESVKDFWEHMIRSSGAGGKRRFYTPIAERMKEIDVFERALHENFDMQEEDKIQIGDADNPFSEQYLTPEYIPPTFERNRERGHNNEEIVLSFSDNHVVSDVLDWEEYTGIYPDIFVAEYDRCLKIRFIFLDAYTESEQS